MSTMSSPIQKQMLDRFVNAVLAAPQSLNLTASTDPAEFWERHVLDTLRVISLLPAQLQLSQTKVVDVGSGNGVPGIIAAIACPTWQLTLIDSSNKKCGFLDTFCKFNAIENVVILAGRAETLGHEEELRERFGFGFARALAKLPVALELTLPFIKLGGLLCIPHGKSSDSEILRSKKTMKELGAVQIESLNYELTKNAPMHALMFKKDHETPEKYPRRPGLPNKRPLV
jgi:16S rRNA (guanine527-N7)-methyltransferase